MLHFYHPYDTEGSVHDDGWVEDFVEMGRSRLGSIQHDMQDHGNETDKHDDEAEKTPPLTQKIKHSGSTNSLSGLLALL